jgi:hypothetical protein
MKRVYCNSCTYMHWNDSEYEIKGYCMHSNGEITKRDAMGEWIEHRECSEKNKYNNCHDYKEYVSPWRRLSNTVRAFFQ